MKIDTNDLVSVTEANTKGVSWLVQRASEGHTTVVLRNNRPAAVVASTEVLEELQAINEAKEDLLLLAATLARAVTDSGERFELADVAAELGFDLDTL